MEEGGFGLDESAGSARIDAVCGEEILKVRRRFGRAIGQLMQDSYYEEVAEGPLSNRQMGK